MNGKEFGIYSRVVASIAAIGILIAQFGASAPPAGNLSANAALALSAGALPSAAAGSSPIVSASPGVSAGQTQSPVPAPSAAAVNAKPAAQANTQKSSTAANAMIGFHAQVYNRENLAALADFAAKYLAPMGFNTIIVEIDDRFEFQSHPEISGGDITAADARAFSKKVKAVGMDVIPLYECLGHQGAGGQRDALLTAHPELDETPWVSKDAGLPDFYCPSWCASDEDVYNYVLPAIDELIDAFGAKTFHVGMDEVFEIGEDSRCKDTSKAVLFANTVKRLHDHLAARGVKMMMWGDRLLDGNVLNHEWEADMLGTHGAISLIPKDIIIADWHYERTSYPSTGMLLDHGLSVWPASWKDPTAALNFLKSARKLAAARGKSGKMMGMLVTDWSIMPVDLKHMMSAPYSSLSKGEKGQRDTVVAVAKILKQ